LRDLQSNNEEGGDHSEERIGRETLL